MLVEDNDLNAEIAATILEGDGAYVSIVGDGAQAVEAFAANPAGTFDAILMDVAMPKMEGWPLPGPYAPSTALMPQASPSSR